MIGNDGVYDTSRKEELRMYKRRSVNPQPALKDEAGQLQIC